MDVSDMLYRVLADGVLVLHLLFILFVVLGGLLVVRFPWLALLHIPAAPGRDVSSCPSPQPSWSSLEHR